MSCRISHKSFIPPTHWLRLLPLGSRASAMMNRLLRGPREFIRASATWSAYPSVLMILSNCFHLSSDHACMQPSNLSTCAYQPLQRISAFLRNLHVGYTYCKQRLSWIVVTDALHSREHEKLFRYRAWSTPKSIMTISLLLSQRVYLEEYDSFSSLFTKPISWGSPWIEDTQPTVDSTSFLIPENACLLT